MPACLPEQLWNSAASAGARGPSNRGRAGSREGSGARRRRGPPRSQHGRGPQPDGRALRCARRTHRRPHDRQRSARPSRASDTAPGAASCRSGAKTARRDRPRGPRSRPSASHTATWPRWTDSSSAGADHARQRARPSPPRRAIPALRRRRRRRRPAPSRASAQLRRDRRRPRPARGRRSTTVGSNCVPAPRADLLQRFARTDSAAR